MLVFLVSPPALCLFASSATEGCWAGPCRIKTSCQKGAKCCSTTGVTLHGLSLASPSHGRKPPHAFPSLNYTVGTDGATHRLSSCQPRPGTQKGAKGSLWALPWVFPSRLGAWGWPCIPQPCRMPPPGGRFPNSPGGSGGAGEQMPPASASC